jgi:hypothetical protein
MSCYFSTLHTRSENGFLDNGLLVYEDGAATSDYHGQVKKAKFEKWIHEKVALNLPCAFPLVLDKTPCHSVQVKCISSNWGCSTCWGKEGTLYDATVRNVTSPGVESGTSGLESESYDASDSNLSHDASDSNLCALLWERRQACTVTSRRLTRCAMTRPKSVLSNVSLFGIA